MKNQIFLLFLLFSICTTYAQHRQQDDTIKRLYLDEYPYANVLEYLNNPDTIFFCHYYPRRTEEKKTPFAISLFVYRKIKNGGQRHYIRMCQATAAKENTIGN